MGSLDIEFENLHTINQLHDVPPYRQLIPMLLIWQQNVISGNHKYSFKMVVFIRFMPYHMDTNFEFLFFLGVKLTLMLGRRINCI